jgi:hypothetical protein
MVEVPGAATRGVAMTGAEIISLAQAREERAPHLAGEALCIGCRHEWVAVAPVGVWQLECPSCGADKGIFKFPVGASSDDLVFTCNCGCEALTAYCQHGNFHLKCMSCGINQTDAVFGGPCK